MQKVKIYVDMDGCVAKWATDASIEDTFQPGYFLNREPDIHLIDTVIDLAKDYEVQILSAVYTDTTAKEEKMRWLKQHRLENIPAIFVPYGHNKADYIEHEGVSFLIDDYSVNLRQWASEPDHFGIKYLNGINATKGTWNGFSISHKMSPYFMAKTIKGIIKEMAA